MTTQPTQDPVASTSPRDLKFNAGKIDEFVTSLVNTYVDRFGNEHYTIEGLRWLAQQAIAAYGWIPVGTFQAGATLTLPNQILKDTTDGEYYRWDGALPKIVSSGSTPGNAGGIGVGRWLGVGDALLRGLLSSINGAKAIGTSSGITLQDELDYIHPSLEQLTDTPASWPPDFTKKTLWKTFPLYSKNWQDIQSQWGYSYVYPQGFTFDEQSNELFIMYSAVYESPPGASTNLRIFIDIYDINGAYKQTVCAGYGYAEGAVIGYVSGQRRIMLAGNGVNAKLGVYQLPDTATLTKYQDLTKVFDTDSVFGTQISCNGKYTVLLDSLLSTTRKGANLSAYSVHLTSDLLSNPSAPTVRKSIIYLPAYCTHSTTSDITPKLQGVCFTPQGILGVGGSQWYPTQYGQPATNGLNLQYTAYTSNGDVTSTTLIGYDRLKDFMDSKGLPVSFFEPEGIVCFRNEIYTLISHANPTAGAELYPNGALSIFVEGVNKNKEGATLNLSDAASKGAFSKGYSVKSCSSYPVNSRDGTLIDTADKAVQYMLDNHIDEFKCAIGVFGSTFAINTSSGLVTYSSDGQVKITTADWNWFNIEITNTSTGIIWEMYRATTSAASPWNWTRNPIFFGGSTALTALPTGLSGGLLQMGAAGSPSRRIVASGALTVENYILGGAIVGGITVNANGSTTFATTSDERRKDLHGVSESVADAIERAVDDGAAQLASFKENPDEKFYMMIAQTLYKHFPQAVVVGGVDENLDPWQVDSSFVVPAMMIAISQLNKRIRELEDKQ
ncbi:MULTISPECIES: hypothetical protein [Pantoea]|uniref:tail fiber/spike domain-containing protein n=1 Tax=Pantoea TaxID=53335 RepID=UPI00257D574F|nr:hypothetical protein [Pantoea sp. UBA5960]